MLFAWTRPSSPTRAKLTPRCTWVSSMYAVEKCMYNLQQQPGLFLSFLSFLSFFNSLDVNFDMVPVSTMQCKRRMHVEDDQNHQNYQDYQQRMQTAISNTDGSAPGNWPLMDGTWRPDPTNTRPKTFAIHLFIGKRPNILRLLDCCIYCGRHYQDYA